jgi:hypothetical protein
MLANYASGCLDPPQSFQPRPSEDQICLIKGIWIIIQLVSAGILLISVAPFAGLSYQA